MCSALVSPHGLKNDEYYMCKVLVSGHWHVTCAARFIFWFKRPISHVWSAWFASRTTYYWYYMCSALVSPHGFKNDVYYMYSALVSLMALRTTYITCSALVSPHFYVCCELTFCWVWSTLARTSCLHRIRSSLFANIVNPLAPVNLLLPILLTNALHSFPVPVAIWLDPPTVEDNLTQVGCIGHVWETSSSLSSLKQPRKLEVQDLYSKKYLFVNMDWW